MACYVMSDIHGCFHEFCEMLEVIRFSPKDELILAGDYIDRGEDTLDMLCWIEKCPKNVLLLRGNHEEEFLGYIDLLKTMALQWNQSPDESSYRDAKSLYAYTNAYATRKLIDFDGYDTIRHLIEKDRFTLGDLYEYAGLFRNLPYHIERTVSGRNYLIVHAGYTECHKPDTHEFNRYCLYAREDAYHNGGKPGTTVIAGHTPTTAKDYFAFTGGEVFYTCSCADDKRFYDIDCGCVFRKRKGYGKLACIRLEDEKIYYV